MASGPTRRQALYFPMEMLQELQSQSARQDRSISWLIQQAWRVARQEMQRVPSSTDLLAPDDEAEQDATRGGA